MACIIVSSPGVGGEGLAAGPAGLAGDGNAAGGGTNCEIIGLITSGGDGGGGGGGEDKDAS